tara:strand:+ start:3239 stop:4573 length:1335 start_codon:yes stop_codon:yes gene_type:complete
MNLKINYNYIYIVIFTFYFFLWGVDLLEIKFVSSLLPRDLYYGNYKNFRLSYLIIILIVPITYSFIGEKNLSFKKIFNYQNYIIFFVLFIVAHFFLIKFYYHEIIDKSEIANLLYLLLLSVIYCHYREFILSNFKKILTLYLIIFVLFSIFEESQIYNAGQCNNDLFLINLIQKYLKVSLTNSIYNENSHLAMMTIAVFFSSVFILVQGKKNNILFLLLFSIEVIIVLNNLSTTYFVGYFFSQITLLLFFFQKLNVKFWIITFLFVLINSYFFLSDSNCTRKITQINVKNITQSNLAPNSTNLTTKIYERSIIVARDTLINHSLGWGIDGMDNAHHDLHAKYNDKKEALKDSRTLHWKLRTLNLKDGLSNLFKLFTEFGIFAFIIFFYFIKYILNLRNIKSYNIFIIVLFVTMCIRGAGYFNGGFIFCLFEFFYYQKFLIERKI